VTPPLAVTPFDRMDIPHKEWARRMMTDPRTVERLLNYMSKAVWLIMAYSFGTMVGKLILLSQAG
jgi:hypothetical protein